MDVPRTRRVRLVRLGLSATAAILLILGWVFWPGPSIDRADRAYQRGDWSSSISDSSRILQRNPGDERAIRLQARGLARLGRLAESLSFDAKLGGNQLGAEDLLLMGQGLLRNHQSILGWAALDAASKFDPKHPGVAEALASRSSLGATSSVRGDRLSAVPSGPALAEMIMGLASLGGVTSPDGDSNRLLDSVLRRDRSTFLKIRSPSDARKLLARLLLEEGRAQEAREWLGTIDDPEAFWLVSRAFLVEGNPKRAEETLQQAGSFGLDQPMLAEPSRYLGARHCVDCHREIFEAQQSSHHSATLAWGEGLKSVPLPAGTVVDPENPSVSHRFDRQGDRIELSTVVGDETPSLGDRLCPGFGPSRGDHAGPE